MKREAKAAVVKAKNEAYKEWYDKMGTEEGERMIYKVAKQRVRPRRDIGEVNMIRVQISRCQHMRYMSKRGGESISATCQGTVWRRTSSRRVSSGNIKERGEQSHTENEKVKNCRMFPTDLIKHIVESGVSGRDT